MACTGGMSEVATRLLGGRTCEHVKHRQVAHGRGGDGKSRATAAAAYPLTLSDALAAFLFDSAMAKKAAADLDADGRAVP